MRRNIAIATALVFGFVVVADATKHTSAQGNQNPPIVVQATKPTLRMRRTSKPPPPLSKDDRLKFARTVGRKAQAEGAHIRMDAQHPYVSDNDFVISRYAESDPQGNLFILSGIPVGELMIAHTAKGGVPYLVDISVDPWGHPNQAVVALPDGTQQTTNFSQPTHLLYLVVPSVNGGFPFQIGPNPGTTGFIVTSIEITDIVE